MLTLEYYARKTHAEHHSAVSSHAPLVLLHGWGSDSHIWQPAITSLREMFDIITVDMHYQSETATSLCVQLAEQLPQQYHLCGWSLGGMLATMLTAQQPQAVLSLMTLATNTQFVASDGWLDAMDKQTYDIFYQSVQADPDRALKRFMSLIAQGDQDLHQQLIFLRKKVLPFVELDFLSQGLDILYSINNAPLLAAIHCPVMHVFGEADSLVPLAVAENIGQLNPVHHINIMPGRGHLLHLLVPDFISAIALLHHQYEAHNNIVS